MMDSKAFWEEHRANSAELERSFWKRFGWMAAGAVLLNLMGLAAGVWVVVKVLQYMGVL